MAFKKILLAVDGSSNSRFAMRHAISLARCSGGSIVLMHCYGEVPTLIGGHARNEITDVLKKNADEILEVYREELNREGIAFTECLMHGKPSDCVIEASENEKCDVIVMGSRGLSDLAGMLLGSVAHRVLSMSGVPVLISR
ncbi:universal stress protein [Oleidesulfovibrio sp.]|uniref:universal stress protein n=1 Tax=Oleidesulfovibrio sp. TaxID=2909707 RepID=UPI003A8749D3